MVSFRRLPGPFGVEVGDIDLSRPLADAEAREFVSEFYRHQLVVVRGQQIPFENFDRLTRQFGTQRPIFSIACHARSSCLLMLSNIFETAANRHL